MPRAAGMPSSKVNGAWARRRWSGRRLPGCGARLLYIDLHSIETLADFLPEGDGRSCRCHGQDVLPEKGVVARVSSASVADLTPNQFTVLRGLAQLDNVGVYSDEFMKFVQKASPGTVKRALNRLEACRLVSVYRKGYRFANPFFKEWIKAEL